MPKFSKCKFSLDSISLSGYIIIKDDIMVDLDKVATVCDLVRHVLQSRF